MVKEFFPVFSSVVTNKKESNSVESEGKRRRKLNYAVWLKKKKESIFIYFTHV